MSDWSSEQYRKFEKERTMPSVDLINRIEVTPHSILDIGCGPGNSTNSLAKRFPAAEITGIDSSDDMLCRARETYPDLTFAKCFVPEGLASYPKFDLVFSNACLHWIPDHRSLFPKIMERLNTGGVLAVQMPLVNDALFYKLLYKLTSEKWTKLAAIRNFHCLTPVETYDILSRVSRDITMWETTYYHIVPSFDAVIEWYKGSGLRPYLDALSKDEVPQFLLDLTAMVKENYQVLDNGSVVLKMPRLFFTAVK